MNKLFNRFSQSNRQKKQSPEESSNYEKMLKMKLKSVYFLLLRRISRDKMRKNKENEKDEAIMEKAKKSTAYARGETSHLMRKVSSGCKYATESISVALDYAKGRHMRELLTRYNKRHEALKGEVIEALNKRGEGESSHPTMAATMTKLHMNISLSISAKDSRLAELMINGCHMGIKTLYKDKHRCRGASSEAQALADELIGIEEEMMGELYSYLR